jgi:hypothetical protein
MKLVEIVSAVLLASVAPACLAQAAPSPPADFESRGDDRIAIQRLLDTYTRAVSTKDEALFETILLNKDIPFSDVDSAVRGGAATGGTRHYDSFRRGVFQGRPFTQKFQDVRIAQDGPLADVSLVFVNTAAGGTSWGWKTLQLLKVAGEWKIASELYTGHG